MLIRELLLEGGNVFDNAGSIHQTEVLPTLRELEKQTGLKSLKDHMLGSTGKKQFSGDIDLSVEMPTDELKQLLKQRFGNAVKQHGNTIHVLFPIASYDSKKDLDQATAQGRSRTGFIQVDFMLGDADWNKKYFYYSQSSKIPGKYRNILLANVAIALRKTEDKGDYTETLGYVFSPKEGLSLRKRIQKKGQAKKTDEVLNSTTDLNEIAKKLLGDTASASDLENVETLASAIQKYLPRQADTIFYNFANNEVTSDHLDLEWPQPIKRALSK
jgi:hypothetical protein